MIVMLEILGETGQDGEVPCLDRIYCQAEAAPTRVSAAIKHHEGRASAIALYDQEGRLVGRWNKTEKGFELSQRPHEEGRVARLRKLFSKQS